MVADQPAGEHDVAVSQSVQVPGGFIAVVVLLPKNEDAAKRRNDGLVPSVSVHCDGPDDDRYLLLTDAVHELVDEQAAIVEDILAAPEEGESAVDGIVSGQGAVAAVLGVEVDDSLKSEGSGDEGEGEPS